MDLEPFVEAIETQRLKVEALIVYQKHRGGACYQWVRKGRRNVFSVSKSVVSIAVGMAIDEGKLRLSDKVTQVFPREKPNPRWDSLTLEHLLTMNMGHGEYSRPRNVKEALSYELIQDPGISFCYDNTCTFLASAMLTKVTGQKLRDYLLDRLFRPLGIALPEWEETDDGYTKGWTGLALTTSEMAVFGRFLLQRGNWDGKQLVSAAWIDAATRAQVPTRPDQNKPDYDLGYGYHFWICRHGAFRCDGKNGQYIVVFPGLDAVVAINSDDEREKPILWAVWDHILPRLKT